MPISISTFARIFPAFVASFALFTHSARAEAQIKRPGTHPMYSVELEPHLIVQHDRDWRGDGEGFGPGFRATIPVVQNGPIPSINNSLGIGFGLDWAFFGGCDAFFDDDRCRVNQVWVPVVAQWNFFFTPIISVFGELGASIAHRELSDRQNCGSIDENECTDTDFDPFEPVFFGGVRFLFSQHVGLVLRVGTPYLSIGADFVM